MVIVMGQEKEVIPIGWMYHEDAEHIATDLSSV